MNTEPPKDPQQEINSLKEKLKLIDKISESIIKGSSTRYAISLYINPK